MDIYINSSGPYYKKYKGYTKIVSVLKKQLKSLFYIAITEENLAEGETEYVKWIFWGKYLFYLYFSFLFGSLKFSIIYIT